MKFQRKIRKILFLAITIYSSLIIVIICLDIRDYLYKADLIVVFGTKVHFDGASSVGLMARLDESIAIYKKGLVSVVFVSSGTGKEGYNEVRVMAYYLLIKEISDRALIIDKIG